MIDAHLMCSRYFQVVEEKLRPQQMEIC